MNLATEASEKLYTKKFKSSGCSSDSKACFNSFLNESLYMIFRRPATTAEKQKYTALYDSVYNFSRSKSFSVAESFKRAFETVFTAAFSSSNFLTKLRPLSSNAASNTRDLTAYEIATRLSFLLTQSTPTKELLDKAKAGQLSAASNLRAEAEVLLTNNSQSFIRNFVMEWLSVQDYASNTQTLNQDYSGIQLADLFNEAYFNIHTLFVSGGSIPDIYDPGFTYVTKDLADHYGLEHDESTKYLKVNTDKHGGILEQVLFHNSTSMFNQTKPITRGVRVLANLLCDSIGNTQAEFVIPDDFEISDNINSPRAFVADHSKPGTSCYGCHKSIDPVGLGLENFDAFGNWRTKYSADDDFPGVSVDAHNEFFGIAYSDSEEFISLMKESDHIYDCVKRKLLSNITAQASYGRLSCSLNEIDNGTPKSDISIKDSVLNIITSKAFTMTRD